MMSSSRLQMESCDGFVIARGKLVFGQKRKEWLVTPSHTWTVAS